MLKTKAVKSIAQTLHRLHSFLHIVAILPDLSEKVYGNFVNSKSQLRKFLPNPEIFRQKSEFVEGKKIALDFFPGTAIMVA